MFNQSIQKSLCRRLCRSEADAWKFVGVKRHGDRGIFPFGYSDVGILYNVKRRVLDEDSALHGAKKSKRKI